MSYTTHYIETLLEMEDIVVTKAKRSETEYCISLELKHSVHTCPCCGTQRDRVHDYRRQRVKEISILGKPTVLLLRKRRSLCPSCGKRFDLTLSQKTRQDMVMAWKQF